VSQISIPTSNNPTRNNPALLATAYMVGAQVIFAVVNFTYDVLTNPWNPILGENKMSSSSAVFWQYLIATIFALPLIFRIGLNKLKTRHPVLHEVRALVSALGAQVFVFGFASGVPVWQMVGLLMTAPFFVIAGSVLFLGERPTLTRIGATAVALVGAFLIIGVGKESFSWATILPILAAALWSTTTVITKYLSREEEPESLTLSLLVLIVVNHAAIGLVLGILAVTLPAGILPASLSSGLDLGLPTGNALWVMVLLGLITAASQYLMWAAYKMADATYLQPFDDLKLPLNTLLAWVVLSQVPSNWFWPGAALIVGASLFVMQQEGQRRRTLATA
jgi:drug/metabolite transporter (DMT)-like permease